MVMECKNGMCKCLTIDGMQSESNPPYTQDKIHFCSLYSPVVLHAKTQ